MLHNQTIHYLYVLCSTQATNKTIKNKVNNRHPFELTRHTNLFIVVSNLRAITQNSVYPNSNPRPQGVITGSCHPKIKLKKMN